MDNPVKSKAYQKAKGMPFAFLFSIVIYIFIFYIFSFSPSTTLFSNTKFWFVISNTLILIIAADYGAFSSSKDQKRDFYEEYYAFHSQATRRSSTATATAAAASFVSQYPKNVEKSIPMEEGSLKENNKEDHAAQMNNEIPEKILEVVKSEPETDNFQANSQQEHPKKADNEPCDQVIYKKKVEPKTIRRSKSDKVKRVTFNNKKGILRRSETENKHDEPSPKDDEFSTMSTEELNRRVEDFIQKFNRQIRLQGARNSQILEYE